MKKSSLLYIGFILKRYKRFLVDIKLPNGKVVVAHTTNTGTMKTCFEPGDRVLLEYHDNPDRKLKYTLLACERDKTWVGVDTSAPNQLVAFHLLNKSLPGLEKLINVRSEVKYGTESSRIDFLAQVGQKQIYLEVKNTTLKQEKWALFPDAITSRGLKHLRELQRMIRQGHRAGVIFIIQRDDILYFDVAQAVDPEYAKELHKAIKAGLEVYPLRISLNVKIRGQRARLQWIELTPIPLKKRKV